MALVPYTAGALVGAHPLGSGLVNLNPKQKQFLKKVVETQALYNVPYMSKAGAITMAIRNQPSKRRAGRSTPNVSRAPAAIGTSITSRNAAVGGGRGGGGGKSVRVSHSALFGSVTGASAFSVQKFRINPGISDLFPWLSGMAGVFDMYRIISMSVRYVPVTGTDTEGALYIAWDPDPLDATPTTKSQVMAYSSSVTGPVWKPFNLRIPSLGAKYVRRGEVVGAPLNTYDNGQLFVCQQSSAVQLLGDLYVDYTVELILPHVYSSNGPLYQPQYLCRAAGVCAEATPLGTLPPNSYGMQCVDESAITYPSAGVMWAPIKNVVSYDNGSGTRSYRIIVDCEATGTGAGLGATLTCSDSGATVSSIRAFANAGNTEADGRWSVTWTRPPLAGSYLIFDFTAGTTLTAVSICITQVADSTSGTMT